MRFANFFFHNPEVDVTWSAVPLLIWTLCEPGMYLVSACLPKYKPLVIHVWKRGADSVQHIRSKSTSSGQSNTNKSLPKIPMEVNRSHYFLDSDDSSSHLAKIPRMSSV